MPEGRGRLAGKVAIVTGVGGEPDWPGTGRAAAMQFAREGAKVVAVDVDVDALAETERLIKGEGGEILTVQADVTVAADCRRAVETAVSSFGRLDVLLNNCGVTHAEAHHGRSVLDVTEESWDLLMDINLKSMMLMSKFAIPAMTATGGGSIINVSSVAAYSSVGLAPYATAKGAVVSLTQDMCLQHGRAGIRSNCIMPGSLYTPMAFATSADPIAMRKSRIESAPLGTEGTAWDFAWAAVFLASDEARWISGVVLPVDGGLLKTMATTRFAPVTSFPFEE